MVEVEGQEKAEFHCAQMRKHDLLEVEEEPKEASCGGSSRCNLDLPCMVVACRKVRKAEHQSFQACQAFHASLEMVRLA